MTDAKVRQSAVADLLIADDPLKRDVVARQIARSFARCRREARQGKIRGGVPFTIEDASQNSLPLLTQCDCAACHVGPSCMSNDWLSRAVEIPAGQSAVIDADLTWFVEEPLVEATCEYVTGFDSCGLAQAFANGGYTLTIAYADQATLQQDSFAPTGDTQWGQKVWQAGSPFVGAYPSTAGKAFTVSGGPVAISANLGGK